MTMLQRDRKGPIRIGDLEVPERLVHHGKPMEIISGTLTPDRCSLILNCADCAAVEVYRPRKNRKRDDQYYVLREALPDPFGYRTRFPTLGLGPETPANG